MAGLAGVQGTEDGNSATATFAFPTRIRADGLGNLYTTSLFEGASGIIRRIALGTGTTSTLAGTRGRRGFAPGVLPSTLSCPGGLVVDPDGDLLFGDFCDGVIGAIRPL